jgi:hypothetical protein
MRVCGQYIPQISGKKAVDYSRLLVEQVSKIIIDTHGLFYNASHPAGKFYGLRAALGEPSDYVSPRWGKDLGPRLRG